MKAKIYLWLLSLAIFGCAEDPDQIIKLRDHENWAIKKMTITHITIGDTGNGESVLTQMQNVFLGGTVSYRDTIFDVKIHEGSAQPFDAILRINPTDEYIDPDDFEYYTTPMTRSSYILARQVNRYFEFEYTGLTHSVDFLHAGEQNYVVTERPMKGGDVRLMLTKNEDTGHNQIGGPGHIEIELTPM